MIKNKEADLATLRSDIAAAKGESRALQNRLEMHTKALDDSKLRADQADREQERLKAGLSRTEKELDSLRNLMAARRSEEAQKAEAETSREKELLALRDQVTKLSKQYAGDLTSARQALSDLEAKHGVAISELQKLKLQKAQSEEDLKLMRQKLEGQQSSLRSAEAVKRGLDSDLVDVRQRLIQHQTALAEAVNSREVSPTCGLLRLVETDPKCAPGLGETTTSCRTQTGGL